MSRAPETPARWSQLDFLREFPPASALELAKAKSFEKWEADDLTEAQINRLCSQIEEYFIAAFQVRHGIQEPRKSYPHDAWSLAFKKMKKIKEEAPEETVLVTVRENNVTGAAIRVGLAPAPSTIFGLGFHFVDERGDALEDIDTELDEWFDQMIAHQYALLVDPEYRKLLAATDDVESFSALFTPKLENTLDLSVAWNVIALQERFGIDVVPIVNQLLDDIAEELVEEVRIAYLAEHWEEYRQLFLKDLQDVLTKLITEGLGEYIPE